MNEIICGDCLQVMSTLPENSVDSIVTDPPYCLTNHQSNSEDYSGKTLHSRLATGGFMGKKWDNDVAFHVEIWQAALRVAKPGAILMAFGGTRTFHRLACAIEDAGWELRDCMMFLYGAGFPKSRQFGCKCGGNHVAETSECDVRLVRQANVSQAVNVEDESREVLLSRLPEQGLQEHGGTRPESESRNGEQSSVEGRSDVLQDTWELQDGQICPLSESLPVDGSEGRLRYGASLTNGDSTRPMSNASGSCASSESRPEGQSDRELGTVPEQSSAQDGRGRICPKCGGIIDFRGYGTALKPAWEPIIVAMKPLEGTYAENAQKWGVAGLNIDGSRIQGPKGSGVWGSSNKTCQEGRTFNGSPDGEEYQSEQNPQGRWPANLLLDEEAAAQLDQMSGNCRSAGLYAKNYIPDPMKGSANIPLDGRDSPQYADHGGASRFFYTAKASSSERNAGLEDMEETVMPATYGDIGPMEGNSRKVDTGHVQTVRNVHPTVKPVSLMRYLCKLTRTPTGGVVLDPFMGSGTTGIACILEHRDFIGIEISPEYAEIARKRIADMTGPLFIPPEVKRGEPYLYN